MTLLSELPVRTSFMRAIVLALMVATPSPATPRSTETTEAFIKHVEASERFKDDQKQFVARAWRERDPDDPASFIVEALAVLSPEFLSGLEAYDDENYTRTFEIMTALADRYAGDAGDPFIHANASVYAIKAETERGRLEEAQERIESFLSDPTAVDLYTDFGAEMSFLRGYTQLQTLQYDDAEKSLQSLLERFPDAPDRLRVTARQILAELRSRQPERIGDVSDLMAYAGRRLNLSDTGERVQERQQRAVDLLDQLIEEAEQAEQSANGSGSGAGSGQRTPNAPMPDSQLPGGAGGGVQLRKERQARPGEAWGNLPPAEREKIMQSLRDRFPSRYRRLVEQYYQELSRQP